MSRIGNRALVFPETVQVTQNPGNEIQVKGPNGTLIEKFNSRIKIVINNNVVTTLRSSEEKQDKQLHGTVNSLIKNMIDGVTKGFEKHLIINGVGYRCNLNGGKLNLSLGFSHPVILDIPEGISLKVPKPTVIEISGCHKQQVGAFASKIKKIRPVEPYKGKGVMYKGQHVRRKAGKSAGK